MTNLSAFSNAPADVKALVALASETDAKFAAFAKKVTSLGVDLHTRTERAVAEISRLDTLSANQRRDAAEKKRNALRREAVKATDKERYDHLRELHAADETAIAIESQFATPVHILARAGLGSEERSRYGSQLSKASPQEILNYARHAVTTGDKVLGAEVASRLAHMSKRERELVGVSHQELAEAMVGDDHRKAKAALAIIRNRTREAVMLNRQFESGRKNVKDKIGLALRRGAEAGGLEYDDDE